MKHYVTLALLLLIVPLTNAQTDKRLKNIEKDLTEILKTTKAPGFSVAIVEKGKVIYAKGFGYSDYENKKTADANTLYAIGSSSKAFTCAVLGQLQNEGKLSFDDSPIKFVPGLKFYNDNLNSNVTIEDLMSHRTGIPRHDLSWYLFTTHNRDSLIQRIQYQEPFTGLRQQWFYNNFMFALQGVIAEKITGKSWEDNIRERFLTPLKMNRTNVTIQEMKQATNAAFGYELEKDGTIHKMDYYDIAAMAPAGSINSSVNDMANWLTVWTAGGKFEGKEIIPTAYLNNAISSHAVVEPSLPGDEMPNTFLQNYGFGWFLSSYKGNYRVEHGGNIDGFTASVAFFPASQLGIVVLANQNNSALPGLVRNTIADKILAVKATDWATYYKDKQKKGKEPEKQKPAETITKPSHTLDAYTGLYSNPGYGSFEIIQKNDSLFANIKNKKLYLKHKYYDIFNPCEIKDNKIDTTEENGGLVFNFTTNDAGEISAAMLKAEAMLDHPLEFKRKPKTLAVDAATLNKYVGNYLLSGITVKVYIKNEKLYLFVEGQPEYELAAVDKNMYVLTLLEGFKAEFVENPDGTIKELKMHQPNGIFTAVKK